MKNGDRYYYGLKGHFEYDIQVYSLVCMIILTSVFFLFGSEMGNTTSINAEIGCFAIFFSLFFRTKAFCTRKTENKLRVNGVFALCRHPLTLSSILCIIGFNLVMLSFIYLLCSIIIVYVIDINAMMKYEKIRRRKHRETWKSYCENTNLILPMPKRLKDYKSFKFGYRWLEDYRSLFITILIIANLTIMNVGYSLSMIK